jgi:hypothetical protein
MAKAISGFMTNDGNFFEHEPEAEFHEAETDLMGALARDQLAGNVIDRFMELCVTHNSEIRRYVNAYLEVNGEKAHTDAIIADSERAELDRLIGSTESVGNFTDDARATEDPSAFQFQPSNRHGSVSDVGSSTRPEAVQDDKKGDGS